jgi:hypothetical protein
MRGKRVWQKKAGVRNEALDCEVYALHAARSLKVNLLKPSAWDALEHKVMQIGRQRFMMTIDNGKMLPMVPIPADAYVLTLDKVPAIIRESVGVSNEDLHAIASICLDKLRYRATPR